MRRSKFTVNPLMIVVVVLTLCVYSGFSESETFSPPLEDWCCEYTVGDINLDGTIDITDLSMLIDNQFLTLTPLPCWGEADFDVSYSIDITDIMLFIDFSFFCDGSGPSGSCFFYCPPPPPYGTMLPLTGCKMEESTKDVDAGFGGESCIVWEYDGESRLGLQHINAGLNCCPMGEAKVTVDGGVITIDERGIDGLCDCICLFDVDMEIANLPQGEYTIVVHEPYWDEPGETFEFTIDLTTSQTGIVCSDRNPFPW
ncbi:MAG: hypothetical protein GY867_09750 [bacterium]|nr:hypothetical protein [bacterium]